MNKLTYKQLYKKALYMSKIEDAILDISSNYYKYLMSLKNVNGIGLGSKYINGKNTGDLCIHVLVENKINNKYLSNNNIVPKEYMGIKTDVIEIKKIKPLSGESLPQKVRPLVGGYGIGTTKGDGTLGCIVKGNMYGNTQYYILSNNHVMARVNTYPIGGPITQPSLLNGGIISQNRIADLTYYVPIKFKSFLKSPKNYVDCAIARILNKNLVSDKIAIIGSVKGVASSNLGMKVKKVGFITGLTEGEVTTLGATFEIPFLEGKKIALFKNQIVAQLNNSEGDSGSAVLNEYNQVVGLLFAGSGKFTIYNDMKMVLYKLNVSLLYKN